MKYLDCRPTYPYLLSYEMYGQTCDEAALLLILWGYQKSRPCESACFFCILSFLFLLVFWVLDLAAKYAGNLYDSMR